MKSHNHEIETIKSTLKISSDFKSIDWLVKPSMYFNHGSFLSTRLKKSERKFHLNQESRKDDYLVRVRELYKRDKQKTLPS